MARNSTSGDASMKRIQKLAKRIMSNAGFITKEDEKVLEFLANKGDFNDKVAVLKGTAELMESEAKQLLPRKVYTIDVGNSNMNVEELDDFIKKRVTDKDAEYFKKNIFKVLKPIPFANSTGSVPFVDEVEEFNELMGKGYQNRKEPHIDPKDAQFVIDFIEEELDELALSVKQNNIVGVLDALLDITYVSLGNGALVFGLKDKILPGYAEVQASNLSKICKTEEEAIETAKVRSEQQYEPCHYEKVGENFVVYRTRDHKVMKSINYFPPNLEKFFD